MHWNSNISVHCRASCSTAVGFFILLTRPNPTITTHQGVAPGDTVPLYYASKTEILEGGSKIWYESLTVNIDTTGEIPPETVVLVSLLNQTMSRILKHALHQQVTSTQQQGLPSLN